MQALSLHETVAVSGGHTPLCCTPHACVAIGAAGIAATYFGWGTVIAYTGGGILLATAAYFSYHAWSEAVQEHTAA